MNKVKLIIGLRLLVLCLGLSTELSCGFQKVADAKFGDQNFKSAIAIIELHKVRFGEYPTNLRELRFTGEWDQIWLNAVEYKKLENGMS